METWEAPEDMQKNYTYYLSGFDSENRPGNRLPLHVCKLRLLALTAAFLTWLSCFSSVWVLEFGKWDIRKAVEQGEDYEAMLHKYIDQFICRIIKSIGDKATADGPVTQLVVIYDMEGLSSYQLASPRGKSYLRQLNIIYISA